jgi:predicted AAA+ superfamily ATPase
MERKQMAELIAWKNSKYRKPLILEGARQVGKTWIMQEFGKRYYKDVAYFDFFKQEELGELFQSTKDPKRIFEMLALYRGSSITPGDTLIIFDEIQESPDALNSLKYIYQDTPEYHVISAGSLLGVTLANSKGAPVGKVDFMTMAPLTFQEYLQATGEERLSKFIEQQPLSAVPELFHSPLVEKLKQFYLIGGMPEAVQRWVETGDLSQVRKVQEDINRAYILDFSKHTTKTEQNRLTLIWDSIPSQLIKENKKFIYNAIRTGARSREYEDALQWIINAGLIQKVIWNSGVGVPIQAFDDPSIFKTYILDVGLLSALLHVESDKVLDRDALFTSYNGGLAENFASNEITNEFSYVPKYWSNNSRGEVDFLVQYHNDIFPIEVKASTNVHGRSIYAFAQKHHSKLRIRYSLQNLTLNDDLLNIPLYMISQTKRLADEALKLLEK